MPWLRVGKLLGWLLFLVGLVFTAFIGFYIAFQGVEALISAGAGIDPDRPGHVWLMTYAYMGVGAAIGAALVAGYAITVFRMIKGKWRTVLVDGGIGIALSCLTLFLKFDRYWSCAANDSGSLLGLGWPLPMMRLGGVCDFSGNDAVVLFVFNALFWAAAVATMHFVYERQQR